MLLSLRSLYERSGGGPRSSVGRVKATHQRQRKIAALQGMMALAIASQDIGLIKAIAREYNKAVDA